MARRQTPLERSLALFGDRLAVLRGQSGQAAPQGGILEARGGFTFGTSVDQLGRQVALPRGATSVPLGLPPVGGPRSNLLGDPASAEAVEGGRSQVGPYLTCFLLRLILA